MDRTENIRAYGWTAVASGGVGLLVGMTALLVRFYEPVMSHILLASILAGAIIGIFSRVICLLLLNNDYRNPIILWGLVLIVVGAGTAGAAECIGESMSWGQVAILVAVAELFGMVVAYMNYRQFIYVNEKLRQKQEQLRDGSLLE
jgi:hypothetical protein